MERITIQRKLIIEAIKELGHATVQDISSYLEKNSFKLSLATIYRNIDVLESENYIQKVAIDVKDNYYEITPKEVNHDHFICKKCGKIIDIVVEDNFKSFEDKDGNFYLDKHVTYYGICNSCKEK